MFESVLVARFVLLTRQTADAIMEGEYWRWGLNAMASTLTFADADALGEASIRLGRRSPSRTNEGCLSASCPKENRKRLLHPAVADLLYRSIASHSLPIHWSCMSPSRYS